MNTTDEREPTADEAMGMAWWNSLSEHARSEWAARVGTGVVADAWSAFKALSKVESNPPLNCQVAQYGRFI